MARTSSKPGKTQTLNFYIINDELHFVDVPGYGFAKVSKSEREAWGRMIETYMTTREELKACVQIVDLRHAPSAEDVNMYEFLKYYGIPVIVIATKADKIPKGKWDKQYVYEAAAMIGFSLFLYFFKQITAWLESVHIPTEHFKTYWPYVFIGISLLYTASMF